MIILECQYCGTEFTAERISAKYCSDSCKTKANTQRRENELIQRKNEARQAEIEREAELKRESDEYFAAEKAENERIIAEQRKQSEEKRRLRERERHEKDREKKINEAEQKFKLTALGIVAALGIGYKIIQAITKPVTPTAKAPHMPNNQTDEISSPNPNHEPIANHSKQKKEPTKNK